MQPFNLDNFKEILHSIKQNKLRTSITVFGVVWGVFLYISLIGISKGMENGFKYVFNESSHNSLFIWANKVSIPYGGLQRGSSIQLNLNDVEELKKLIPEIEIISPRIARGIAGIPLAKVKYKNQQNYYKVFGDFPELDIVTKREIINGRFINQNDLINNKKVCIIGEDIYNKFYKNGELKDQHIEISNTIFKIIGVYKSTILTEVEEGNSIIIPYSTFSNLFNTSNKVLWFSIALKEFEDPTKFEIIIKNTLKKIKNLSPNDNLAFSSINFGEEYIKFNKFLSGLKLLTTLIGFLTILSGVISVGNILIISIKERTKEIGIKRALGAKPAQIKNQIILESIFLTLSSSLIGFIFSIIFLAFLNVFFSNNTLLPFYNPTISIFSIIFALFILLFFSTIIGLITAQKAIKNKPVDSLRTE